MRGILGEEYKEGRLLGDPDIDHPRQPSTLWQDLIITRRERSKSQAKHQDFESIDRNIRGVREDIVEIKQNIQEIHRYFEDRPDIKTVWLADLGETNITVKLPIPVTLEEYTDEVLATWLETETFATADTPSEAIGMLKHEIATLFEELSEVSDEELGKLPKMWKRTLESFLQKDG